MKKCPHCSGPMIQRYTKTGQRRGWNCPPCANDRAKAYRLKSPDNWLDAKLWTFYRIRLTDFRRMLAEQNGRCAGCGQVPDAGGFGRTGFVIDHDHSCCDGGRQVKRICGGCVRGLLCTQCNVALGMVNDDTTRLRRLAEYVERHQSTSTPA